MKALCNNTKGRNEELTVHMLKVWSVWGQGEPDRAAHAHLWKLVERVAASNIIEYVARSFSANGILDTASN